MRWVAILTAVVMLVGCRPSVEVVERVRYDTLLVMSRHSDTIVNADSVIIRERLRGDTLLIEKERIIRRERIRIVRDTIREHRVDSVPVVVAATTATDNHRGNDSLWTVVIAGLVVGLILLMINRIRN